MLSFKNAPTDRVIIIVREKTSEDSLYDAAHKYLFSIFEGRFIGIKNPRLQWVFCIKTLPSGLRLKTLSIFDPDHLDTTIFRPAFFRTVIGDGVGFSIAFGTQPISDALHFQVINH